MRRLPATNHYERLGVQADATSDELRRAYRQHALDAHPDRRTADAPDSDMAAINEAWNVLGDPSRRAEYDRTLSAPSLRPTPPPAPARSPVTPAAAGLETDPDDELEAGWVDLTPQLRRFRRLLTTVLVLGALFMLAVFWLIIWPETA